MKTIPDHETTCPLQQISPKIASLSEATKIMSGLTIIFIIKTDCYSLLGHVFIVPAMLIIFVRDEIVW